MWSNFNCILGENNRTVCITIKLNGVNDSEPETTANASNSYFKSIPTTLSDNINNS